MKPFSSRSAMSPTRSSRRERPRPSSPAGSSSRRRCRGCGVELARLAVGNFVAIVEQPDRGGAHDLAPDGAQLVELLVGMQQGDPAGLGRAVELEQSGIGEHLHDRPLGVDAGRRRRDHQLGHPVEAGLAAICSRHVEHHGVMRGHQRGEGDAHLADGAQAQRGIEARCEKTVTAHRNRERP